MVPFARRGVVGSSGRPGNGGCLAFRQRPEMQATDLKLLLIPAALLVWARIRSRPERWVHWAGAQLLAALLFESVAWALSVTGNPNAWVYNLYMPIEFGTLSLMLLHVPRADPRRTRLSLLAALLYLLVLGWELASDRWDGQPSTLLNLSVISGGLLLAFLAMFAGLALADADMDPQVERAAWWMLASVSLYFMSFIPVFGLLNHFLKRDPDKAMALARVNDLLFVIRYSFMAIAFIHLLPRARRT